jgi:serine/threonine-protein kinase
MTQASIPPPSDVFGWGGSVLDSRYRIDTLVGEGGFGAVYKGHHLAFDEPIAIKFLKLDRAVPTARRARFLEQFSTEGKLLYRLSQGSPFIVRAIDVGAATSPKGVWAPYIVLEWVNGRSLDLDLAERSVAGVGGRSLREAIDLLDPAARALDVAHEQGVAHRDVKPPNLIVTEVKGKPAIKVLDFGVAKVIGSLNEGLAPTTTGSPHFFTPAYGAPEQFERRYGSTGPHTDVFALALVLVEVVTARRALAGEMLTEQHLVATDPSRRPTVRSAGMDCNDAVEDVLRRALAVAPSDRYRRAGEFWDALLTASGHRVSSARARDPVKPVAVATEPDRTDLPAAPPALPPTVAQEPSHAAISPVSRTVDDPNTPESGGGPSPVAMGRSRRTWRWVAVAVAGGAAVLGVVVHLRWPPERAISESAYRALPPGVQAPPAGSIAVVASASGDPVPALEPAVSAEPPASSSEGASSKASSLGSLPNQVATLRSTPPPCREYPYCGTFSNRGTLGNHECGCRSDEDCKKPPGQTTGRCVSR